MLTARDEQSEVADLLRDRFPAVQPEIIREQVAAAFADFATAPIQAYTSILVQRAVRRHLLDLTPDL
jgi:hypothetical protein